MIEIVLPKHLKNEDEKEVVASFKNFTTYFTGFFTNRKNMYSDGEESTAIAYRCINENLPKHLDNVKAFEKAISKLSKNAIDDLDATYSGLCGTNLYDVLQLIILTFCFHNPELPNITKSSAVTQQATVQKLRVLTNI